MTDSLLDEAINLATARTPDEVDRSTVALTADALLRVLLDNEVIGKLGLRRPCPLADCREPGMCMLCHDARTIPATGDYLRAALRLEPAQPEADAAG